MHGDYGGWNGQFVVIWLPIIWTRKTFSCIQNIIWWQGEAHRCCVASFSHMWFHKDNSVSQFQRSSLFDSICSYSHCTYPWVSWENQLLARGRREWNALLATEESAKHKSMMWEQLLSLGKAGITHAFSGSAWIAVNPFLVTQPTIWEYYWETE